MYRLAKIDYMTGQFDSADLAAKYTTTRMMFVTQIKPKQPEGNGWFAEAISSGVTPKPESPMVYRKLDLPTIQKIRSDLYDGMTPQGASKKYHFPLHKIKALISKYKWGPEIAQRRAARNQKRLSLPPPEKEVVVVPPPQTLDESIMQDFDSDDIGVQMKGFIKVAMVQLKLLTGEIMANNNRREKMSPHQFQDILDKFCQIAEAIKKVKSATPGDLSGSGGSGRLVRAGVLADAKKSATEMAPTIQRQAQA